MGSEYTEKPHLGPLTKEQIFDITNPPFDLYEYCLYALVSGSHAYGIATKDSDVDTRGIIHVPDSYIFGLNRLEQVESQKKDICFYGLHKFFSLAYKSNVHAIELLWIDPQFVQITTSVFEDRIKKSRHLFMSKNLGYSFGGYATQQLKLLNTKKENATGRVSYREKYGWDTKFGSHAIRLLRSGAEALLTGELQVYRPDREELLAIKQGALSFDDFMKLATEEEVKFKEAWEKSTLPDSPDFDKINDLLIAIQKKLIWENI